MTTSEKVSFLPQDLLDRADRIIRQARAAGRDDVAAEAVELLASALRLMGQSRADSVAEPDLMTRARARVEAPVIAAGRRADPDDEPEEREPGRARKLRKGRDQCTATRRDGEQCEAPAIKNGLVCRRHGGAAPQVAIAAEYLGNQVRAYAAHLEFEEARGTAGEFDALCKVSQAQRELAAYEVKLRLYAELRSAIYGSHGSVPTYRPVPTTDCDA